MKIAPNSIETVLDMIDREKAFSRAYLLLLDTEHLDIGLRSKGYWHSIQLLASSVKPVMTSKVPS